MQKDTVSIWFVRAAIRALSDSATRRVLEQAKIPAELLRMPCARVSARSFSTLWLTVAQELDDEFFGLDSRRMKPGSFALLTKAVLQEATIGVALRKILKGFAVFLDDVEGELVVQDDTAGVVIHSRIDPPEQRRFADETLLVMIHGLTCWLAGQRIPLLSASFGYPRPQHAGEYRIVFTDRTEFSSETTCVWFDSRVLERPVVQNAATVKQFLRLAPQSVFLKYKNEDSWTARLRRRLRNGGNTRWPTLKELADELQVAPATLRRRLESEGATYQSIKDHLRRDIAIHHLSETTSSVSEIAEMLGFQETSAFHRAFKRWTGSRPGAYRSGRHHASQ